MARGNPSPLYDMKRFELYPNMKLSLHRKDDADIDFHQARYLEQREKALQKAGYKCCYCGLEVRPDKTAEAGTLLSSGYLEVHHIDNDHQNNDISNLAAICPFCHAVIHLGFSCMNGRVFFAYIPELTQIEINLISTLCGVGLVAANNKSKVILEISHTMREAFIGAGHVFAEKYKFTGSEFVSVLLAKQKENPNTVKDIFKQIKIVPMLNNYPPAMFTYWADHMITEIGIWEKLYAEFHEKFGDK